MLLTALLTFAAIIGALLGSWKLYNYLMDKHVDYELRKAQERRNRHLKP